MQITTWVRRSVEARLRDRTPCERSSWVRSTLLLLGILSFVAFSPGSAQHRTFSFAWLSDTHVGGTTGADDLRRTVADLNRMDSLDFVLLSGDITEMGWQSEFEQTHQILSDLRLPYYIIPGNHDMKWSESGGQEFVRIFGSDRFVFTHKGCVFIGMHQGPVLRMGDGHFPPEDVRWLDSLLATIDSNTPLIFVTHYPLTPSIDNWYEASNRLRTRSTQAVLVGHGHRDRILDFAGLPGVMGRSNLRARDEHGGYTIVRVSGDSLRFFERITGLTTQPQRHALPVGLRTFEQRTESAPHHEAIELYPQGQAVWTVSTGWTMTAAPVVNNGRVYSADRSGMVRCLQIGSGTEIWRTLVDGPVLGNHHVGDGYIVGTTTSGNIFCLDAATGEQAWTRKTGHANVASPYIHEGIVYTGTSTGSFLALDVRTGDVIWTFDDMTGFVESRPLVTDTRVIFGSWNSYLYCLDRASGELVWKWNNGTTARLLSPAAVWPVASKDHVFIVAPDRAATVLDIPTGAIVWRSGRHQVRESAGVSEDGTRFYAKSMNDTLFAYDAASSAGQMVWKTDCRYGYDIANSMPVEKDGVVYFGTKNGLVYALEGSTGTVLWVYKLGNTIINTVAPVDGNTVVVSTLDGELALLSSGQTMSPEHQE